MEWIAAAVAAVAAAAAIWQAWEARRARGQAQASAAEAADHEGRALSAWERTARALEEQAAAAKADRERYSNPWTFGQVFAKSGKTWTFRLGGDEQVTGVGLTFPDEYAGERISLLSPIPDPMRPGESISLNWFRVMNSPTQITVDVVWVRPNGKAHSSPVTLLGV